jgi:hypothetical protein
MTSFWISIISLLVCGILALGETISAKWPNLKKTIDALTPHQTWIGIVVGALGVFELFSSLSWINLGLRFFALTWLSGFVAAVLQILLGFMLGFPFIKQLMPAKADSSPGKLGNFQAKLVSMKGMLGFLAIIVAIVLIILTIRYYSYRPVYFGPYMPTMPVRPY